MVLPPDHRTVVAQVFELLIDGGLASIRPAAELLLNEAMKIERSQALEAAPYERTEERKGYANGFKSKTIQTRIGPLELDIPKARGLKFYPQAIERGQRSEVALKVAIAEMYVMGVSTRKVKDVTEALCGLDISSAQVSRVAATLDEQLEKFRSRPLGEFVYVYLDARYEKVRYDGVVRDMAVLTALGINAEGMREVLGVSVALSEAEVHWRSFLESLQARGLRGVRLFISDDHAGLRRARRSTFPSVPWQRCQFHLAQNAQAYAPKVSMRKELAQALRDIFNSPTREDAEQMKKRVIERYSQSAPGFAKWVEANVDEGLTVFSMPEEHRRKLRTSNPLERGINREIKRRTTVASLFPNEASCLRLVTAVLQEMHEDWITGKRYLTMTEVL